jgi:hypothetical protein
MLRHDPDTGEFDNYTCHVCGGMECSNRDQFRQHCASRKHHARLRRIRGGVASVTSGGVLPQQQQTSQQQQPHQHYRPQHCAATESLMRPIEEVYASLFATALNSDQMCQHIPVDDQLLLPQYHFNNHQDDQHHSSNNTLFESDQQLLLQYAGLDSLDEYANLKEDDERLSSIISCIDETNNNSHKNNNNYSLLQSIKLVSPSTQPLSLADRALLQHDLRSNTIFGFDTETANSMDYPYVRSALGGHTPQLLQIAVPERVWIFELSSTVEYEKQVYDENNKKDQQYYFSTRLQQENAFFILTTTSSFSKATTTTRFLSRTKIS